MGAAVGGAPVATGGSVAASGGRAGGAPETGGVGNIVVSYPAGSGPEIESYDPDASLLDCEFDGAVPLPLPGCPDQEPEVGDCTDERLRCLYPSEREPGCYAIWECLYGLWSPREPTCGDGDPALASFEANVAACPATHPALETPCAPNELECGYGLCSWLVEPVVSVVCRCGRWVASEHSGCTPPP
jgi:hypothetical protein